jgi:hypothetical protein
MTLEQVAVGLQILAIAVIGLSACIAPMLYSFWKNKKK